MQEIVVKNLSSVISPASLAAALPAFQRQVSEHFAPTWGVDAHLIFAEPSAVLPVGSWLLGVFDNSDQASSLGYHDVTSRGDPLGKVFAKTTKDDGGLWTVTFTHELLEMLGDPGINLCAMDDEHSRIYAYEACFAAGTLVAMADGSFAPIELLVGKRVAVRSVDADGTLRSAMASCRKTRRWAATVKVRFSNGSTVVCTPDHRFMLETGEWVEAKTLACGARILSERLPSSPLANPVDSAEMDSVFGGQFMNHSARRRADLGGLRISELGSAMPFAASTAVPSHPPLGCGVEHVLAMSAEENMLGVGTSRIVTAVTDKLTSWYRSVVQFVRNAVDEIDFLFETQVAIAGVGTCSVPQPTSISLDDASLVHFRDAPGSSAIVSSEASVETAVVVHSSPMGRTKTFRSVSASTAFDRARFHALIVDAVEESDKCDVYDLTVPGFHNFVLGNGAVVHNCDPCEADELGYAIDGVRVTDFVLPSYFEPGSVTGVPRDFCGHINDCFELAPGGYLSYLDFKTSKGWQQIFAERPLTARSQQRQHGLSRAPRRGKSRSELVRSRE